MKYRESSEYFDDYISIWDNVIDNDVCNHIIKTFDECKEQQEKTKLENVRSFSEINLTKYPDTWSYTTEYLYRIIKQYAGHYTIENQLHFSQFPKSFGLEEMRMKRYETLVDNFDYHVDVGDYVSAKRFLVAFIYLNDVSLGGQTEFPNYEKKVVPKAGRLLMFPSTWTYLHKGHAPISNAKYIIGTYFHYL